MNFIIYIIFSLYTIPPHLLINNSIIKNYAVTIKNQKNLHFCEFPSMFRAIIINRVISQIDSPDRKIRQSALTTLRYICSSDGYDHLSSYATRGYNLDLRDISLREERAMIFSMNTNSLFPLQSNVNENNEQYMLDMLNAEIADETTSALSSFLPLCLLYRNDQEKSAALYNRTIEKISYNNNYAKKIIYSSICFAQVPNWRRLLEVRLSKEKDETLISLIQDLLAGKFEESIKLSLQNAGYEK